MLLEAISAVPISSTAGNFSPAPSSNPNTNSSLSFNTKGPSAFSGPISMKRKDDTFICCASNDAVGTAPANGLVFQPFEEVKKDELTVPTVPNVSLARHVFSDECEAAINEQINIEYSVSYVYHAAYAYFDRDNVALKGFAKLFKESSVEERGHAEKLMWYQNMRGGKVMLSSIQAPPMEFDHPEKGDALHAMELALSLEKLNYEKLLKLYNVADENNDHQMMDFIDDYLEDQVESIKKIAEYVAQLRRVGKGHGVWHFDRMLLENDVGAL